jgi:Nif-specific regulatory protein
MDRTPRGPARPRPDAQGEKLAAVLRICRELGSERDLARLLDLIAGEAARLLDADRASIFLLDRETNELWSQVALGSEPIRFDASLGIAGAVVATGETVNASEVASDPRFYRGVDARRGYRTRSLLAVPLRDHQGEIVGAFEVLNRREGAFDGADEEILTALAAQAGVAIETAQLFDELRRHRDRLLAENTQLRREVERQQGPRAIVGTSARVRAIVELVEQIRDAPVDVLVTGESGTGKELYARALHFGSARAAGPFVALNCAALPENLVESELFGIEKGTATGVAERIGRIEEATGGTLFLDEIGDLSLTSQAKILRALQERVVERVGGRKRIPVDVRVVAATHRDLEAEIRTGRFREDLYYRLRVVHIETPPLRELREDLPHLADHFLEKACRELGREPKRLAPEALACLAGYPWPGNVRELENEVKRLVAVCPRRVIQPDDLSPRIRKAPAAPPAGGGSLHEAVAGLEQRMIRDALRATGGSQAGTARALGLSRQGLIKKLKRYGIGPEEGRR